MKYSTVTCCWWSNPMFSFSVNMPEHVVLKKVRISNSWLLEHFWGLFTLNMTSTSLLKTFEVLLFSMKCTWNKSSVVTVIWGELAQPPSACSFLVKISPGAGHFHKCQCFEECIYCLIIQLKCSSSLTVEAIDSGVYFQLVAKPFRQLLEILAIIKNSFL